MQVCKRWTYHRNRLDRRTHNNRHLQNAWLKYGAAAFEWTVICEAPREELPYIEASCIVYFNATYNKAIPTESNTQGRPRSRATKTKISKALGHRVEARAGRVVIGRWPSIRAAAVSLGVTHTVICWALQRGAPDNAFGFSWRLV